MWMSTNRRPLRLQVLPSPFEFRYRGTELPQITHVADSRSSTAPPESDALRDAAEERLEFLNQEIVDLREQLDAIEDWDLYESVPLKHQIILYEYERNQLVGDHNRRVRGRLDETARRARRVDAVRDEIDWCENKIALLREEIRQSSNADAPELRKLLKGYEDYWHQLMRESGRLPDDCPAGCTAPDPSEPSIGPQTVEFVRDQRVSADEIPVYKIGKRRGVTRSNLRTATRPPKDKRKQRAKRYWTLVFKAVFRKLLFAFMVKHKK
jgi:hypothetical protein